MKPEDVEKLLDVLAFYADHATYRDHASHPHAAHFPIWNDMGKRARAVLRNMRNSQANTRGEEEAIALAEAEYEKWVRYSLHLVEAEGAESPEDTTTYREFVEAKASAHAALSRWCVAVRKPTPMREALERIAQHQQGGR